MGCNPTAPDIIFTHHSGLTAGLHPIPLGPPTQYDPLMNIATRHVMPGLLLGVTVMLTHLSLPAASPEPVDLKSAAQFTILAGTAITSAGGTIQGNIGLSPTTGAAITGLTTADVAGVIYTVDGIPPGSVRNPDLLTTAFGDLTLACNDAAGRTNADAVYAAPGNIGSTTLVPGLYKFTSEASITGGNLTLTGGVNDVWIFQIGSTLTVGEGIHVILTGGAEARNVFWQVGSSVTIETSAAFKGTLMANVSITMKAGSTLEGRALAFTAVTFSSLSGSLPTPEAPRFTHIFRATASAVTVVLTTTPYFLLTLEACPDLLLTNWSLIATDTPITSPWTNTDLTATATVTQRFYRAFITP